MRSAIKHHPDPLAIALAVLFSLLLALTVLADHDRRGGYDAPYGESRYGDSRYDGRVGDVAALADRLDAAAYEAYRLSERRSYASLDAAFRRFAATTERFRQVAGRDRRASSREFEEVVRQYYDLRGEFRYYDGPRDLRTAFHRINTPMERLYRSYTGRDLYRDDPNARNRGSRDRHRRGYDDRRHDDRGHDRGVRRRGADPRHRGHGRH